MIGILPTGGKATRINGIPKWLLPTPQGTLIQRHIRDMQAVNPLKIVIMSKGINTAILHQTELGGGVIISDNDDQSMTDAVMLARDYTLNGGAGESVIFGMPDTYFECRDVYHYLRNTLEISDISVDVAVAVCRARPGQHKQGGMVRFSRNQVLEVVDKPADSNFEYIWGALAWKPTFWDCLTPDMPHVGYGLPVAIERGLNVRAVVCEGGFYDCGVPERYFELVRTWQGETVV